MNDPDLDQVRDDRLVAELAEPAAELFNRHLSVTKNWYPFEDVPFEDGRSFGAGIDPTWDPAEYPLPDGVRSALIVNLLTEDNLPYYTSTLLRAVPDDHPLSEWSRRWTAEEWRHSAAMRDWMLATRAVDPYQLEDDRMVQMSGGIVPVAPSAAEMFAYVSFQELATQVAHRNTGRQLDRERQGKLVMSKIAGDEGLHHAFYRDLVGAALQRDPSYMMVAIQRQLRSFKMPGTGIPGFAKHEIAIARAGIFDAAQFLEGVVRPTLAAWKLEAVQGLDDAGEKARDRIRRTVDGLARLVSTQNRLLAASV
jgi:acyl-[acyl-carrier-protein] desaturase